MKIQSINEAKMEPSSVPPSKIPSPGFQSGGFILSRTLRDRLQKLSERANPPGLKVVRWTDLLEAGVEKLTIEDLLSLRMLRERASKGQ